MNSYNNQFRDLPYFDPARATYGRNPMIDEYSSNVRYPHWNAPRRPNEYNGRLRQTPRDFHGLVRYPGISCRNEHLNVSISSHSTVRWLNNGMRSLKPSTHTPSYRKPANLIPISDQMTEPANKSDSNQPPKSVKSDPSTKASADLDKCVNSDTVDCPGDTSIASPSWLKSEPKPVEEISTIMEQNTSSMQDIEVKSAESSCVEGVEQTTEPTSGPSSILKNLPPPTEFVQNRHAQIQSARARKRRRQNMVRSMRRGIERFSLGTVTNPISSSNMYTNYLHAQQSNSYRGGNYLTMPTVRESLLNRPMPPQPSRYSCGYRTYHWNNQSSAPRTLMPRTFNSGPRPRFPFGQRVNFGDNRKNAATSSCHYDQNRRFGQNCKSSMANALGDIS